MFRGFAFFCFYRESFFRKLFKEDLSAKNFSPRNIDKRIWILFIHCIFATFLFLLWGKKLIQRKRIYWRLSNWRLKKKKKHEIYPKIILQNIFNWVNSDSFSLESFANNSFAKVFPREMRKFRGWVDPRNFLPAKVSDLKVPTSWRLMLVWPKWLSSNF